MNRTLSCDFSLTLQIALVTDDDHGEVVLVLYSQNLLLECGDFLKALARRDGVDQQETLSRSHVLLPHGRVLLLAGSVENVEQSDLLIDDALLAVRVCSLDVHVSMDSQW